jgi:sterol desaturase/sphingolipid hydroxylase (fatty acid hydroxylase superfamily)
VSFSQTSATPFAPESADARPFEVSTIGATAVIAAMSIAFAGAAWLIADSRPLLDAFSAGSVLRRVGATVVIALRSPAPVLMLALVLERLFPVTPHQRDLTRGFCQDIVWYAVDYMRELSWIPLLFVVLVALKRHAMGNFELIPDGVLPAPILLVVGILAGDFLAYWSHRLRHRFDVLWNFHAIHHSQRDLNFFTQNRFHDVDTAIDLTIRMLPLLMLHASWTVIGIYSAISLAHFRLYHSKIRSDYGVLRYILVTPQSHRIHHARDRRHHNCNFGGFFSIWDHVFGTQYENYDEYPEELGIRDESFPIEQGAALRDFPRVFAAQMLYPFRKMLRTSG